jgi:hypothetical protein
MKMQLVSSQRGQFAPFEKLLKSGIPQLVRRHPKVFVAMIDYGLILHPRLERAAARHRGVSRIPKTYREGRPIIERALSWGTAPTIMVMDSKLSLGSSNWYGNYKSSTKTITIHKPLVVAWQAEPADLILCRAVIVVVLHELVHYLNDLVLPGSSIHTEDYHLRKDFHVKAFQANSRSAVILASSACLQRRGRCR